MINFSALFSFANLFQVACIAALGYIIQQSYGQPSQQHRSAAAAAAAAAASQSSSSRGGRGPSMSKKKGGKNPKAPNAMAGAAAAGDSQASGQPAAGAVEEEVCKWNGLLMSRTMNNYSLCGSCWGMAA